MTIYAYYRVSTEMQDYESQKVGVVEYCKRCGHNIEKEVVDDGVSGTVEAKKRNLWKIVKAAKKGDWLITSELSRLGRSTADVLNTCNILSKNGVNVWFVKQGMGLDQTPMGKMMVAILSAFAEMERDLISQRTVEGLKRAQEKGIRLGRKVGTFNPSLKLDKHKDYIIQMANSGVIQSQVSRRLKCDIKTLVKYCERHKIVFPVKCQRVLEFKDEIIRLANEGLSDQKIAEQIGFTQGAVNDFRHKHGIAKMRKSKPMPLSKAKISDFKKEIEDMIYKGYGYSEIGRRLNFYYMTVCDYCKKNGLLSRKAKSRVENKKRKERLKTMGNSKQVEPTKRIKLQPMESVWFGAKKKG